MAKVLVTGATGFIGWNLTRTLVERGDDVTCLVRRTSVLDRLRRLDVAVAYGDVTDRKSLPGAMAGRDVVYHVAGCTNALRRRQYDLVNHLGVGHVAAACADQLTPPVLVTVSSLAAVGPSPGGRPRMETDSRRPVSNYGRSKRAGELAALEYADRVPITIVRPPIVLGKADDKGLELFRAVSRFRVHLVPGWTPHRFSVIDADDVANLLILAAGRGSRLKPRHADGPPSAEGFYFAACEQAPTYADLGRMVGAALGRRRVWVFPVAEPLVWMVAAVTELVSHPVGRPLYFNLDKAREVAAGSWTCSAQAAIEELGFHVGAPLPQRLRETAEWYRREGWL
jgi:nucleoside-diphosphate-sugar epimerase